MDLKLFLIDSPSDHIERPIIDIQYVFAMVEKARQRDDGTLVESPTFTGKYFGGTYENCVCGHEIVHNYLAMCDQTGKGFLVGSDCILTVCNSKNWNYKRICRYCEEDALKTKNWCKNCSSIISNFNKTLSCGKHARKTFYEIYKTDKAYIEWIKTKMELSSKLIKLQEWIFAIEEYPLLLEDYEHDNEDIKHEIESKSSRVSKAKVYLKVKYEDKELAKEYGMRWDVERKSWYITQDKITDSVLRLFPSYHDDAKVCGGAGEKRAMKATPLFVADD